MWNGLNLNAIALIHIIMYMYLHVYTYVCIYNVYRYMYNSCINDALNCAGVGVGEGDSDSGVHVDDGTAAVGALDHLVHQTVCPSLRLCLLHGSTTQGVCHQYPGLLHTHVLRM